MKHFQYLLVLVAIVSVSVMASERYSISDTVALRETMSGFNLEDPEADARLAATRNDFRFIGLNGYSCEIPGPDRDVLQVLTSKYGVRCLEGTSDVIMSKEFGQLQEQARSYAIRYNLALAMILDAAESGELTLQVQHS